MDITWPAVIPHTPPDRLALPKSRVYGPGMRVRAGGAHSLGMLSAAGLCLGWLYGAQAQPPAPEEQSRAAPVQRLANGQVRIGNVRVDLKTREVRVTGKVNEAAVLEFIANATGGYKAYESALELDTNATNFNVGLLLIGLDKAHAVVPRYHLDPRPPAGDPVEIWVEWGTGPAARRVKAEELVYNESSGKTLPERGWVYTGSSFMADSGQYLAEMDGTLIGFVHTPSPVIDYAGELLPGAFGSSKLNPALNLAPGTPITLTVRSLVPARSAR